MMENNYSASTTMETLQSGSDCVNWTIQEDGFATYFDYLEYISSQNCSWIPSGEYYINDGFNDSIGNYSEYSENDYSTEIDPYVTTYYILAVAATAGIFLNLVTISSILYIKSSLTLHLKLLLSLAFSDLLLALHLCGFGIIHVLSWSGIDPWSSGNWYSMSWFMAVSQSISYVASLSSILNLTGLAIDHYIAIKKPFVHKMMESTWKPSVLIGVAWLASSVIGAGMIALGQGGMSENHKVVVIAESAIRVVATTLCLIIMLFCYININVELKRRQSQFASNAHGLKTIKKCLITSLILLATFLIGWLPYVAVDDALYLCYITGVVNKNLDAFLGMDLRIYLYILFALNTVCDPVIYSIRIEAIRASNRRMAQRIFASCRRQQDSQNRGTAVTSTRTTTI